MLRGLAIFVMLGLVGCSASDGDPLTGTTFALTAEPEVSLHKGTNSVRITVRTLAGAPVTRARVELVASMPAHAHDAPAAHVVEQGGGAYQVDDLVLAMPGAWDLRVVAALDGRTDGKTFRFDVP